MLLPPAEKPLPPDCDGGSASFVVQLVVAAIAIEAPLTSSATRTQLVVRSIWERFHLRSTRASRVNLRSRPSDAPCHASASSLGLFPVVLRHESRPLRRHSFHALTSRERQSCRAPAGARALPRAQSVTTRRLEAARRTSSALEGFVRRSPQVVMKYLAGQRSAAFKPDYLRKCLAKGLLRKGSAGFVAGLDFVFTPAGAPPVLGAGLSAA
jgi:hypothetical protein